MKRSRLPNMNRSRRNRGKAMAMKMKKAAAAAEIVNTRNQKRQRHTLPNIFLLKYSQNCRYSSIYVYSLRNCSSCWRKLVDDFSKYNNDFVFSDGTELNGAIHWLCLDMDSYKPSKIAVFRLEDEKFWMIPLPASFTCFNYAFELGVFEGCLCILPCGDDAFWAMREYGVNQSWAKLHIKLPFLDTLKPLASLRNDEEAICLIDFSNLVLYNTRRGTSRDLIIDDNIEFLYATTYVDSLVSPVAKV
ncbi:F-box/kelch-repeat protein At3g06240-like [Cornus florida]|uniref:F-box/kelch-repeat protein At3g06240-like n=1 Tax=Cornus florida TaxID=4283 RepID=UPI0028A1B4CF|nr:F-box/kelch-repeat protein At3g06240-like [Cornus florida]